MADKYERFLEELLQRMIGHRKRTKKRKCKCTKEAGGATYTNPFTEPPPGDTTQVWNDDGVNYICCKGQHASDSNGVWQNIGVGVYYGSDTPPDEYPGPGAQESGPTIYQTSVDPDTADFDFDPLVNFPTGAAATVRTPGAANVLAWWYQDALGNWSTLQEYNFYGHYNTTTDCGDGGEYDALEEAPTPGKQDITEPMMIEVPSGGGVADAVCRNGQKYICVRGSNAYDPVNKRYLAVLAKIYPHDFLVPDDPPFGDLLIRIVNVTDDRRFAFDNVSTWVPGAFTFLPPPNNANILAVWPVYAGGDWGPPTIARFTARDSIPVTSPWPNFSDRKEAGGAKAVAREMEKKSPDGETGDCES